MKTFFKYTLCKFGERLGENLDENMLHEYIIQVWPEVGWDVSFGWELAWGVVWEVKRVRSCVKLGVPSVDGLSEWFHERLGEVWWHVVHEVVWDVGSNHSSHMLQKNLQ
jgi:hypothetical protein